MIPATRVTVIGYGPCGKATAETLQRLGARVSVADLDPYRALGALMHGHRVGPVSELLPDSEVVFLATGHPDVISSEQLDLLQDGTILVGVGHEPYEADLSALSAAARKQYSLAGPGTAPDARMVYQMPDGREIIVLEGTTMINLIAAGGNPIQTMDLGLSLQASSLAAIAGRSENFNGPQRCADGRRPAPGNTPRRALAVIQRNVTGIGLLAGSLEGPCRFQEPLSLWEANIAATHSDNCNP